jgi:catalase
MTIHFFWTFITQLPINKPVCPVLNHNRDGKASHRINAGNVNYWPNRHNVGAPVPASLGGYEEWEFMTPPYNANVWFSRRFKQKVEGIKQRVRGEKFQEHFNQAQLFYNSLAPHEKAHLVQAFSFELDHCDDPVVYKSYIHVLNNIDHDLARTIAINVGGDIPDAPARLNHGKKEPTLSQMHYIPKKPTIASRRIAVLVADGCNMTEIEAVRVALKSSLATTWIIGPRRGEVYPEGTDASMKGTGISVDHHYEGQRSTMFDAIYVPSGAEHAKALLSNGRTVHWIREAFGHCKAIGAVGEGLSFLPLCVKIYN